MVKETLREIIPLTVNDCLTVFYRIKSEFNFPLHSHEEFEINLVLKGSGAKRIIGDHIGEITDTELVLLGPNLTHTWQTHNCKCKNITEVTVQFHKNLLDESFLNRNQLKAIKEMLNQSSYGLVFSEQTTKTIVNELLLLNQKSGFTSILSLFSILNKLSTSSGTLQLSKTSYAKNQNINKNSKITACYNFMNDNFNKQISLGDVAKRCNMTEVAFSRFFKEKTGINFINILSEIRLGHATKKLIETSETISEIAYYCGFTNISNFDKAFKKTKGCTPKKFRQSYKYEN